MERIRIVRGRMPGVDAEDPGSVAPPPCAVRWLAHCRLAWTLPGDCAVHHTGAAPASVFWSVIASSRSARSSARPRLTPRAGAHTRALAATAGALAAAATPRRRDMPATVL